MFLRVSLSIALVAGAHAFFTPADSGPGDSALQTLSLPEYPNHAIRIKEQSDGVCDAGSKQYTGWLDTGGKHLFFWYFESRSDPHHDPLLVWLNGGPGASSLMGMFMELGPCLIKKDGSGTYRNVHSWTSNSSMIFIDQPAGVGFSYAEKGLKDVPSDSFAAAADMIVFMRIFYEAFPHFKNLDFHISGESYGGHYEPAWAAEIVKYNARQTDPALKIPLKSVLIGNGYVDPFSATWGFYDTLCTTKPGVPEPIFNETRCAIIEEAMPRCEFLSEACASYPDIVICNATQTWCEDNVGGMYMDEVKDGGRNPYDITATCDWEELCYGAGLVMQEYLNTKAVWKTLEVPKEVKNYTMLSAAVGKRFRKGVDPVRRMVPEVKFVLESGVDVLIYNGNLDLLCNTWGSLRWSERMSWTGQMEFATKPLLPWYATKGGKSIMAGEMKEVKAGKMTQTTGTKAGRFSFVTVAGAGHLVPMDQPEVSLQLLHTWLKGGEFAIHAEVAREKLVDDQRMVMGEL